MPSWPTPGLRRNHVTPSTTRKTAAIMRGFAPPTPRRGSTCTRATTARHPGDQALQQANTMNKPSLNTLLQNFETEQLQRQLPDFGPGDTVVVNVKVKEGNRER